MNTPLSIDQELSRILDSLGLHPGLCPACDNEEVPTGNHEACWRAIGDGNLGGEAIGDLFHPSDRAKGAKAVVTAIVRHHAPIAHLMCQGRES